jgi:hypothetical protein
VGDELSRAEKEFQALLADRRRYAVWASKVREQWKLEQLAKALLKETKL